MYADRIYTNYFIIDVLNEAEILLQPLEKRILNARYLRGYAVRSAPIEKSLKLLAAY